MSAFGPMGASNVPYAVCARLKLGTNELVGGEGALATGINVCLLLDGREREQVLFTVFAAEEERVLLFYLLVLLLLALKSCAAMAPVTIGFLIRLVVLCVQELFLIDNDRSLIILIRTGTHLEIFGGEGLLVIAQDTIEVHHAGEWALHGKILAFGPVFGENGHGIGELHDLEEMVVAHHDLAFAAQVDDTLVRQDKLAAIFEKVTLFVVSHHAQRLGTESGIDAIVGLFSRMQA